MLGYALCGHKAASFPIYLGALQRSDPSFLTYLFFKLFRPPSSLNTCTGILFIFSSVESLSMKCWSVILWARNGTHLLDHALAGITNQSWYCPIFLNDYFHILPNPAL